MNNFFIRETQCTSLNDSIWEFKNSNHVCIAPNSNLRTPDQYLTLLDPPSHDKDTKHRIMRVNLMMLMIHGQKWYTEIPPKTPLGASFMIFEVSFEKYLMDCVHKERKMGASWHRAIYRVMFSIYTMIYDFAQV